MFLRSCFKEQIDCANNLKETYDAFRAGDIDKLKECRNSFAKGTVKCAAVVGLNAVTSKVISSAFSGTPLAAVYHAIDEIFDDKLNIATAVVNGLAAAALTVYAKTTSSVSQEDLIATINSTFAAKREAEEKERKETEAFQAKIRFASALFTKVNNVKKTEQKLTLTQLTVLPSQLR